MLFNTIGCCVALMIFGGGKCYADFIRVAGELQCANCNTQEESVATQSWGTVEQGFQISLRIPNEFYAPGKPVFASVAMRNTSNKPVTFGVDSTLVIFELSVIDPGMKDAMLTDYGQQASHRQFTATMSESFRAHGLLKMRYPLDRLFDFTKMGKYFVTARYGLPQPRGTNGTYAISNTVTVQVVAASSEEPKGK